MDRSRQLDLSQLKFPIQYLEVTEAFIKSRGADMARVRKACGIREDRDRSLVWIDGHQFRTLLDAALAHCLPGEPPALQILKHFPVTAFGVLGVLAITSGTVGHALDAVLRYHSLVMPLFHMHRLPDTPQGTHVRLEPVVDFAPHNELMAELVIGVLRNVAPYTQLGGPVLTVEFSHEARWPIEHYTEFFGVPPRFGAAANAFCVSRELLQERLITSSHATRASLEPWLLREVSIHEPRFVLTSQVRQRIVGGLQRKQQIHSETIAYELAMSPRTLSRRLQSEGTSLKRINEQARVEYAEQLLSSTALSIQEIALSVGFADASSFIRAFKRITGDTPAARRERIRTLGGSQVA